MSNVLVGVKPLNGGAKSDPVPGNVYYEKGYDTLVLPITNAKYRETCKLKFKEYKELMGVNGDKIDNLNMLDVPYPQYFQLNPVKNNNIIGLLSSWVELDSRDKLINEFSSQVLRHEVSYASFLGIQTVIIAPPRNLTNLQIFTSNLNSLISSFPKVNFSISLPICEESRWSEDGKLSTVIDPLSTWDLWNSIRSQCDYAFNLSVSLALPKGNIPRYVINRWVLEPIKCFLINTSRFITNAKGFPVLSKFNQIIIWFIIQKRALDPPALILHGDLKDTSNLEYLKYLVSISSKNSQLTVIEHFNLKSLVISNRQEQLQTPLQPYQHDLDNLTYQIFEKDAAKYDSYERAFIAVLKDASKNGRLGELQDDLRQQLPPFNILVVGPGQGPLISKLFMAIKSLGLDLQSFRITAIEKNPNVIPHLAQINYAKWSGIVTIINESTNSWEYRGPFFNLVISELLGSFGCNELSPECLNPLEKYCEEDCIFIPQSYSSYIAPATSPAIYSKLSSNQAPVLPLGFPHEIISTKYEHIWTFEHPSRTRPSVPQPGNLHNKRTSLTTFKCHHKGVIHGVLGYFTAVLYPGIHLSNMPSEPEPPTLISWLPIFFPLESPIYISDDQEVSILMKREYRDNRVWYEWSVECFMYLVLPSQESQSTTQRNSYNVDPQGATAVPRSWSHRVNINQVTALAAQLHLRQDSNINSIFNSECEKSDIQRGDIEEEQEEEYQLRVRTGVSRVHNAGGRFHSLRL